MHDNNERSQRGQRRVFHDDCGAWGNTRGSSSVVIGNNFKELFEKDGLVCDRKQVEGKQRYVPLPIQPDASTVRKVTRLYYQLKRCPSYTKRITMLSGTDTYLCEYSGTFPDTVASHGNCHFEGTEYVRTQPHVQAKIREQCLKTKNKPKAIYTNMTVTANDESTCPRNVKQVQNVSAKVTAELIADKKKGTNNLADEMLTLCTNIAGNEFVQNVSISAHHAPCVVLYTKQQLFDLKRFCGADAPANMRSVLGVDRTFNVSSLYLTLTVFKNNSLVRSTTMRPPIWLGPMFLHGDATFTTYLHFFTHLRDVLDVDLHASELKVDGMCTGSDEEAALVKAVRVAFSNTSHLFCILHCEDNVRDHVTKTGIEQSIKQEVLKLLFGSQGVASSSNEAEFDNRTASTVQYVQQYCPSLETYISERVVPKLLNNAKITWSAPWLGTERWTNNACESANSLLKLALDWKPARLTDLVQHLHEQVDAQYRSASRALIGQGEFILGDAFVHHKVSYVQWHSKTAECQQDLIKQFLEDTGNKKSKRNTVTSTDGSVTIVGSNAIAKKPGQRRRPHTERSAPKKRAAKE